MTNPSPVAHVLFSGIGKQYGNRPPVLQDIDLTIKQGEFVSIIGPSGCGKSTLLKLVSGLASVTQGSIRVDGMTPIEAREIVSFIFQDPTLLPWRTVEQNVSLGLELEGAARDKQTLKVKSLLDFVGLSHVARSYPRELSGGMKMRVSIARALATTPRILLMDEPFAALDEMSRDRLNEELLRLREEQKWTVLFVTHSVTEAVFLSTRILVMAPHPGRLAHDISIAFPFPRTAEMRNTAEFDAMLALVSKALRGVHPA